MKKSNKILIIYLILFWIISTILAFSFAAEIDFTYNQTLENEITILNETLPGEKNNQE